MRQYFDIFIGILLGIASLAVTTFAIVWVIDQQPYAHKADIAAAVQKAATATHSEQVRQDVASAVILKTVDKAGAKLKSTDERIRGDETAISDLYKRVAELRKGQTAQQTQINSMRGRDR